MVKSAYLCVNVDILDIFILMLYWWFM